MGVFNRQLSPFVIIYSFPICLVSSFISSLGSISENHSQNQRSHLSILHCFFIISSLHPTRLWFWFFPGAFPSKWTYMYQMTDLSDLKRQQISRKWERKEISGSVSRCRIIRCYNEKTAPPFPYILQTPRETIVYFKNWKSSDL